MTKEKKLKTELIEFSVNLELLNGTKRKVEYKHKLDTNKLKNHPELKDTKFHKSMQDNIIALAEKQENLLSGDKMIKLAEKSVSRYKVLQEVYQPNDLEALRKLLQKELNPGQLQKKMEDGTDLFSKEKLASMRSLIARFTKYALLLFSHKDMFKVREDAKKVRRIYAKHNDIYPNIYGFDNETGKKIPTINTNSNLVMVTTSELDKLYGKLIQGKAETIKLPDSVDDLESKDNQKSEPTKSVNGATAGTIAEENNFDILNRFITLAITKDPKKFVEDVTGKNFANVASDTKDPLIELLKPNTAKTVLNFIREVIIHGSKEHQSMSNEENKNKINQIIKLTSGVHYDTTKKQFTRLD